MRVSNGSQHWTVSIEIPLWIFNEHKEINTLKFNEECTNRNEDTEGVIWVIYQNQNTLLLASEYYLKNNFNKDNNTYFDTMPRMFNTEARIIFGRILFEFNTYCGIEKKDLEQGVCFIENGFVKIGLRN